MKNVYTVNKVLLIVNTLLFLTIYFGLLFLIVTGIVQILCFIYYMVHWEKIDPKLELYFRSYGVLVPLILCPFLFLEYLGDYMGLLLIPLIAGSILAICFTLLSRKQMLYSQKSLKGI